MTDGQGGAIPPGYYDDGHGVQRYWDGKAWTQQTKSTATPAANPAAAAASEIVPTRSTARRRPRVRTVLTAGAIVLAFVLGIAVGSAGKSSDTASAADTTRPVASAPTAEDVAVTTPAAVDEPARSATPTPKPKPAKTASADETKHGVTAADARIACRMYGDATYPYGFDDHSILGVIAERIDDGRWFIKHEVTITNAFDAKRDTVFECTVGGTHSTPMVREFFVYD